MFDHTTQLLSPVVLVMSGMGDLLEVLHVCSEKQMPQWREVTVALQGMDRSWPVNAMENVLYITSSSMFTTPQGYSLPLYLAPSSSVRTVLDPTTPNGSKDLIQVFSGSDSFSGKS